MYLETGAGASTLLVDNNGMFIGDTRNTLMPEATDLTAVDAIVVRDKGVLALRDDTVFDLNTANLVVNGAADAYLAIAGDGAVTYPADWSIEGYTLRGEGITETLGDVTIRNDGALSHSANSNTEATKLVLHIAGDLVVEATGAVHGDGGGFMTGYGSGGVGWTAATGGSGATHGGVGGRYNTSTPDLDTYGSILSPTTIGSGAGYNGEGAPGWGGGAVVLRVAGATVVNGRLSANATSGGSGPSGGSVNLTTATLSGGGTISADGGPGTNVGGAGGGGRVAIRLTGPKATFSAWSGTITASGKNGAGGTALNNRSSAGTILLAESGLKPGEGKVVVDNGTIDINQSYTALPAMLNPTEDLSKTSWETRNDARIGMPASTQTTRLSLSPNGKLDLYGATLTVGKLVINNVRFPVGTYTAADSPQIDDTTGGGEVVVIGLKGATMLMVR